jgi:Mn-dependent DtxR family transcriptional regulator
VRSLAHGSHPRKALSLASPTPKDNHLRWLLLSLDRFPSNELAMTQDLIANMLGVLREGVTEAAGHLQAAGLIRHSRGHITVLDRSKLEQRVCECYSVVKKETDRLLPNPAAS